MMTEYDRDVRKGDATDPNEQNDTTSQVPVVVTMNDRQQRFYDGLRSQLKNKLEAYQDKLSERAVEYLLLLPDLFVLLVRLAKDRRVANEAKVIAGVAIAYIISPVDIVPDFFFGIGYLDDVVLAVYALKRILVDVKEDVLLDHWSGEQDLLGKIREIIEKADQLVGSRVVNKIRYYLFKRKS